MLTKNIFRNEIKHILLEQMIQGKIKPGNRISLPSLSSELEVSVTPVREALTQLTETGIVTYLPNRGFFVTELSEKEASEIYELISVLECEAIKKSSFNSEHIRQLTKINTAFGLAKKPEEKLKLDIEFHRKLIGNYSNQYVHQIIENVRIRIIIYEYEFMSTELVSESATMHNRLIKYLQSGEIVGAINELKVNWNLSIDHIMGIYKTKQSS